MACRFPGACDSPEEFWRFLEEEKCAISRIPRSRFKAEDYFSASDAQQGLIYTDRGAFLDDIELFDAAFFNIAPSEARCIDPQQRLLIEVAWDALQRANLTINRADNRCGLFVGSSSDDYAFMNFDREALDRVTVYNTLGIARSMAAGRVAYHLGLMGPAVQIDTACSSSLSAVHLACQSLALSECDTALAAGVNLILSPHGYASMCRLNALSPQGMLRAFDDRADGYVRGEGCGVVVLKRLRDAELASDNILATIIASAMNHDGASNGLTAPNARAQVHLHNTTLARGGVDPADVGYIEAHGSGTRLGDSIEIRAIAEVYGRGDDQRPLLIGSVKNNIGHLEAAAGVAGLQKLVMCLRHRAVPAHINCDNPNKFVDWDAIGLETSNTLRRWDPINSRLCGAVSSFGLSGTNVQVLVERYTPQQGRRSDATLAAGNDRTHHIWTLSERSVERLERNIAQLVRCSVSDRCADIGYTLNTRRPHGPVRAVVIASSTEEALQALAQRRFVQRSLPVARSKRRIVFLFTGQGAQYPGMCRDLYQSCSYFKETVDHCAELLRPLMSRPLLQILFASKGESLIDQTEYSQPCLFVIEYCLAKLWERWGVTPDIVLGHSVGEIVAATVAGVMSLSEGLELVVARAKLMQSTSADGRMLVIEGEREHILAELRKKGWDLDVAAINSPTQIVFSGRMSEIEACKEALRKQGVVSHVLSVSRAFHSHLLEPIVAPLHAAADAIAFREPRIPLLSNLTGAFVNDVMDARYWARHVRSPVLFSDAIGRLLSSDEAYMFVEIGPQPILTHLGKQHEGGGGHDWLPSLRRGQSSWKIMLESLSTLHLAGVSVDWIGFDVDFERRLVVLPAYPFVRQRFE